MSDKKIWYFGFLTLSFLGLIFISGCLNNNKLEAPAATTTETVDVSPSESVPTSTTNNTTNTQQIIINPAEVCTTTPTSVCTDDELLIKRIPYETMAVGLARPNDLRDSLLLDKVLSLSSTASDLERQFVSIGDQLFSFIHFTFADLTTLGVGAYPKTDVDTDGVNLFYLFRFATPMSEENFAALGTVLTSGTQLLDVSSDSSTLHLEITQMEVGADYYIVSLTDTSGSISGSQSCIIEKQVLSCTSDKVMLEHLKYVKDGTEASIYGTEKDDYFACHDVEGYINVPEMVKWAEASDLGLSVDQWTDFDGTVWVKFDSYSASYVVDPTSEEDLFGYGNLQTTYLNNNVLQARVTAEVTESFVINIFDAFNL